MKHYVFSYGTLADKFNSSPKEPAVLYDYYEVQNKDMFPWLKKTHEKHKIYGWVIELTPTEFKEADVYEGYPDLYQRTEVQVELDSGEIIKTWLYI